MYRVLFVDSANNGGHSGRPVLSFEEVDPRISPNLAEQLNRSLQEHLERVFQPLFEAHFFGNADADEQSSRQPAASKRVLQELPVISLAPHDLEVEGGVQCVVCLTDFVVGEAAVRIPCGHLFHEACIKEWLQSSNQCAVCRWELATDDPAYELVRQANGMKLRLRISDLRRRTVRELHFLAKYVGIKTVGCLEKVDLVNQIVSSGLVDIIAESHYHVGTGCESGDLTSPVANGRNGLETPLGQGCVDVGQLSNASSETVLHDHRLGSSTTNMVPKAASDDSCLDMDPVVLSTGTASPLQDEKDEVANEDSVGVDHTSSLELAAQPTFRDHMASLTTEGIANPQAAEEEFRCNQTSVEVGPHEGFWSHSLHDSAFEISKLASTVGKFFEKAGNRVRRLFRVAPALPDRCMRQHSSVEHFVAGVEV